MRNLFSRSWGHRGRPPADSPGGQDPYTEQPHLGGGHHHHHHDSYHSHYHQPHKVTGVARANGQLPNGGGLAVYRPAGRLTMAHYDSLNGVGGGDGPRDGRKPSTSSSGNPSSNLIRQRNLFSSMPSLLNGREASPGFATLDKKTLKKLEKEEKKMEKEEKKKEKEEKRRRDKEEKRRRKEEQKMLASGTLPRNWGYVTRPEDAAHQLHARRRPQSHYQNMQLYAVPIDFEDLNHHQHHHHHQQHHQQQQNLVPVTSVPTTPTGDANFMLQRKALHASAPDLARLERVYGATLRRMPSVEGSGMAADDSLVSAAASGGGGGGGGGVGVYRGVGGVSEIVRRTGGAAAGGGVGGVGGGSPTSYVNRENSTRMAILQKTPEGYGFVLRGARAQSAQDTLDFVPSAQFPALQYLDSVEPGGQSFRAGLAAGDFILEINGEDVRRATHEKVVQLIRASGDFLALKVIPPPPTGGGTPAGRGAGGTPLQRPFSSPSTSASYPSTPSSPSSVTSAGDWIQHSGGIRTLPSRYKKAAPTPPQRDPRTSLSYSKATSKALTEGMAEIEQLDLAIAEFDQQAAAERRHSLHTLASAQTSSEQKVASVRAAHTVKRVSVIDMMDAYSQPSPTSPGPPVAAKPVIGDPRHSSPRASPVESRLRKFLKKGMGSVGRSKSTPNLAEDVRLAGSGDMEEIKSADEDAVEGVARGRSQSSDRVLSAARSSGFLHDPASKEEKEEVFRPVLPDRAPLPKRKAPAPPPKGEMVKINTAPVVNAAVYANVSEEIAARKTSPYESSFRPGTSAQLTTDPKVMTQSLEQAKLSHRKSASVGSMDLEGSHYSQPVPVTSMNPGTSAIPPKEHIYAVAGASVSQKHPNALPLVPPEVHAALARREPEGSSADEQFYEPEPDYDADSGDENNKAGSVSSPTAGVTTKLTIGSKQSSSSSSYSSKVVTSDQKAASMPLSPKSPSVTVIAVGPMGGPEQFSVKSSRVPPAITPKSEPYTSFSSQLNPSAPQPAADLAADSGPRDRHLVMSSNVHVVHKQDSYKRETMLHHSPPPDQPPPPPPQPPSSLPPPLLSSSSSTAPSHPPPPPPPPPPPAPPLFPPPSKTPPSPPPPPLPTTPPPTTLLPERPTAPGPNSSSSSKLNTRQASVPALIPANDILAAVAQRRTRLENEGPRLTERQKSAPSLSVTQRNQDALKAAVAQRREMLEKMNDSKLVDDIESRLNKNRKLQAHKFFAKRNRSEEGERGNNGSATVTSPTSPTSPIMPTAFQEEAAKITASGENNAERKSSGGHHVSAAMSALSTTPLKEETERADSKEKPAGSSAPPKRVLPKVPATTEVKSARKTSNDEFVAKTEVTTTTTTTTTKPLAVPLALRTQASKTVAPDVAEKPGATKLAAQSTKTATEPAEKAAVLKPAQVRPISGAKPTLVLAHTPSAASARTKVEPAASRPTEIMRSKPASSKAQAPLPPSLASQTKAQAPPPPPATVKQTQAPSPSSAVSQSRVESSPEDGKNKPVASATKPTDAEVKTVETSVTKSEAKRVKSSEPSATRAGDEGGKSDEPRMIKRQLSSENYSATLPPPTSKNILTTPLPKIATIKSTDFLALAEKARQDYLQKISSKTLPRQKSTEANDAAVKAVNGKGKTTENVESQAENVPKPATVIKPSIIQVQPAKRDDAEAVTVSIKDKIQTLQSTNLALNGGLRQTPGYEVGGVTEDHSHTEAGLSNGTLKHRKHDVSQGGSRGPSVMAPPPDFADGGGQSAPTQPLTHIDIIPPPPSFGQATTDSAPHGVDDAASFVSSTSSLSTMSSDHGDSSSRPAQHYDDIIVPPPPPDFSDETPDSFIPPPVQFTTENGKGAADLRPFHSKAVDSWHRQDVLDWLDSLDMGQYKDSFALNAVDGPKLQGLERNDYIELGVLQVGHRMDMQRSIKRLSLQRR